MERGDGDELAGLLEAAIAISTLGGESRLGVEFLEVLELPAGGGWLQLEDVVR